MSTPSPPRLHARIRVSPKLEYDRSHFYIKFFTREENVLNIVSPSSYFAESNQLGIQLSQDVGLLKAVTSDTFEI